MSEPYETVNERHTTGGPGPEGQPDTVDETASIPASVDSEPETADEPEDEKPAPRKRTAKA